MELWGKMCHILQMEIMFNNSNLAFSFLYLQTLGMETKIKPNKAKLDMKETWC